MIIKHIGTGAVFALMTINASGQQASQVYGVIDLSVYSQQLSGENRRTSLTNGNMTTSFIGFRGSENLGNGYGVHFNLESFFRSDTGEVGRTNTDTFFQRAAWVGLSARELGTIRLGRQVTPNWLTSISYGPFGGATGLGPFLKHTYMPSAIEPMVTASQPSDAAWSNSIGYSSPNWGGLSIMALYALSERSVSGKRIGARINYDAGPFAASVSIEDLSQMARQFGAPAAPLVTVARPAYIANENRTVQAAASYEFGVAKIFGQVSRSSLENVSPVEINLTTTQVGTSIPVGPGKVLLSWAHTRKKQTLSEDQKRDTVAIGYDHNLSKRTDAYAVFLNDRVTGLKTGSGLAIGLRHKF
jgi:predicted porin